VLKFRHPKASLADKWFSKMMVNLEEEPEGDPTTSSLEKIMGDSRNLGSMCEK
jgi:hypothetical protein